MKLICVNAWGGKCLVPLINLIKEAEPTTDIFCFQEVFHSNESRTLNSEYISNLYDKIQEVLSDFQGSFSAQFDNYDYESPVDFPLSHGQATFVRNTFKVRKSGEVFVFGEKNKVIKEGKIRTVPENVQYVNISHGNQEFVVCNIHGIPNWPKIDTPERIKQSKIILDLLQTFPNSKKILCGDFNLFPETKSIQMLEASMKNLIKEYKIKKTRSALYERDDKISDYIFVSQDVTVKDMQVLDAAVSDHLPLVVEFE
ncbi:hypothetical protein CL629_04435 [bacterium]|nr:hypothetical protein [bacterium]|tara:strand:- start:7987 stop:8754 length:768 start_codon:yes stop_codon:yes gene_type:complete